MPTPQFPEKKEQPWKRHQRPTGECVLEHEGTFVEPEIMDRLIDQVMKEHKGKSVAEKCHYLKELIAQHGEGDASATTLPGAGRGEGDYLADFDEFLQQMPEQFSDVCPESVKTAGDKLLATGKKTGYEISAYNVAQSDYSKMLSEGANRVIYHGYASLPEHGQELLRRLEKAGTVVPYDVAAIGSTTVWDDSWTDQKEIEVDQVGDMKVGRSVQYAIAFQPETPQQAEKLVKFFKKNSGDKKEGLKYSWKTPDIRSSFVEKVAGFTPSMLNVKKMGEYELLVLKSEPINGFEASKIWLNKELSAFAKSIHIGILLKAVPPGSRKPGSKYIEREGVPGKYQYTYEDEKTGQVREPADDDEEKKKQEEIRRVRQEQERTGKTPLPDAEKLEEKQQVRRELFETVKAGDWHAFVELLNRRNIQKGTKQYDDLMKLWADAQRGRPRR